MLALLYKSHDGRGGKDEEEGEEEEEEELEQWSPAAADITSGSGKKQGIT